MPERDPFLDQLAAMDLARGAPVQPEAPSFLSRAASAAFDPVARVGGTALDLLNAGYRGVSQGGEEVARRIWPLYERDKPGKRRDPLTAIREAIADPEKADFTTGRQFARGMLNINPHQLSGGLIGDGSDVDISDTPYIGPLINFGVSVAADALRDPFFTAGPGTVAKFGRFVTPAGKSLALTARGAEYLKSSIDHILGKGVTREVAEKVASSRLSKLIKDSSAARLDFIETPGLTINVPFSSRLKAKIPGTETPIGVAQSILSSAGNKLFPNAAARGVIREAARVQAVSRAGILSIEAARAKEAIKQTIKMEAVKSGADGDAVFRAVTDAIESPAGTHEFTRKMNLLPEPFRPYAEELRNLQKEQLSVEQFLQAGTQGLGKAAEEKLIRLQMDMGLLEKQLAKAEGRVAFGGRVEQEGVKSVIGNIEEAIARAKDASKYNIGLQENVGSLESLLARLRAQPGGIGQRVAQQVGGELPHAGLDAVRKKIATVADEIAAVRDELQPEEYFAHLLTPEARAFLEKQGGEWSGVAMDISTHHASQLKRRLPYSISEANRLVKEGKIKGFEGFKGDIFVTDPRAIATVRSWRHIKSITNSKLAMDLAQFGKSVERAGDDWVKLPIKHPSVENLLFPPEVAKTIQAYFAKDTPNKVKSVFDAMNTFLRRTTLMFFPGWAMRNLLGNVLLNAAEGSAQPRHYTMAMQWLYGAKGKVKSSAFGDVGSDTILKVARGESLIGREDLIQLGLEGDSARDFTDMFLGSKSRRHVLMGMSTDEMLKTLKAPVGEVAGSLLAKAQAAGIGGVAKGALDAATFLPRLYGDIIAGLSQRGQEAANLAHLIARVEKGDTLSAAVASVRKYQGIGKQLTPMEKNLFLDRGFLFYRWARHNYPLQVMEAVRRPGRLSALLRLEEQAYDDTLDPHDRNLVPRFSSAALAIPHKKRADGTYELQFTQGVLPMSDIALWRIPFLAPEVVGESPSMRFKETTRFIFRQVTPLITAWPDVYSGGEMLSGVARKLAGPVRGFRIPGIDPDGMLLSNAEDILIRKVRLLNTLDRMVDSFREPSGIYGLEQVGKYATGLGTSVFNPARESAIAKHRRHDLLTAFRRNLWDALRAKDSDRASIIAGEMIEASELPPEYFIGR